MGHVGASRRSIGRRHLRRRRETRYFIVLCLFCFGAVTSANQGDVFLDLQESYLATVAAAVQINDAKKCELLSTCTAANCSRNTCLPEVGDIKRYQCLAVTFNKYCNASAPGCTDKNFDYTRSFLRTAVNTEFNSVWTTVETCAQRALDPVFQNLSTPGSVFRMSFGGIDGSYRAFPGSDEDVNNPECSTVKYDNRLRPWYRASTSVPKVVAILVDAGQSMSTPLSAAQGQGTILDAVKVIVREFFKTLEPQDYVNIIMFGSTKVTPLSPSMVQVLPYQNLSDTTYLPELDPLLQSLDQKNAETQPGTSNVAGGINAALSIIATVYPQNGNFIVIFSDATFATASNVSIPVTNMTSLNVKLFIYKIPQQSDSTLFLGNTSFANQLCSVGGSFEVISSDLSNPLLALNSFFTFTAALHAQVTNNQADYSIIYPGYEGIEGNITTVSRPVFSAIDKSLLGVAGLDISIEYLGNLTSLVQAAILNRSLGQVFIPTNFVLTSGGCNQIQTALPPATPCSGVAIPPNGGFCVRTDYTSTIQELACCGNCAKPGRGQKRPNFIGVIVGSTLAGIVVVIVLGIVLWKMNSEPVWNEPEFGVRQTGNERNM